MSPMIQRFNTTPRALRVSVTAVLAALGGLLAARLGVPLPWLLGSLVAVAMIALCGADTGVSDHVRKTGQVMAGFSVGLFFTLSVAERVLSLGWLMVLSSLCSILASIGIALLLAHIARCDRSTAYFAMLPGGLAEMAGFAQQFHANVAQVTLSQTLRVVVIVLLLPNFLHMIEPAAPTTAVSEHVEIGYGLATAGLAAAVLAAMTLQRMRIFNPWLLGGLATGIAIGLAQSETLYAPEAMRIAAQIAIGAALGTRFKPSLMRSMNTRFIPVTVLATVLLIAVNCLFALAFASLVPFPTGTLATAPGGIAEMSLTAEAMQLAPPLVTAWQLVRIILVAVLAGPLYLRYARFAVTSSVPSGKAGP